MDWTGASANGYGGSFVKGANAAWVLLPTVLRDDFTDPTLMVTRAKWVLWMFTTTNAAGSLYGAGIIDWSSLDDFVFSFSEILAMNPTTRQDMDWIWRVVYLIPGGMPVGIFAAGQPDSELMSKARRRMGNNKGFLLVIGWNQPDQVIPVSEIAWAADFRFLIKE
jgi:hypothetical protein